MNKNVQIESLVGSVVSEASENSSWRTIRSWLAALCLLLAMISSTSSAQTCDTPTLQSLVINLTDPNPVQCVEPKERTFYVPKYAVGDYGHKCWDTLEEGQAKAAAIIYASSPAYCETWIEEKITDPFEFTIWCPHGNTPRL